MLRKRANSSLAIEKVVHPDIHTYLTIHVITSPEPLITNLVESIVFGCYALFAQENVYAIFSCVSSHAVCSCVSSHAVFSCVSSHAVFSYNSMYVLYTSSTTIL